NRTICAPSPSRRTVVAAANIRRNADVGITPIMPTFELCRPGRWFAWVQGDRFVGVGITRAVRGRQAAGRVAGSDRVGWRGGWRWRWRVPSGAGRYAGIAGRWRVARDRARAR